MLRRWVIGHLLMTPPYLVVTPLLPTPCTRKRPPRQRLRSNGHGTTYPMLSRTLASWIFRYQSSFDQCIGDLWAIRPYNTQHEMDYPSDAHSPGSPWLIRFI